MLPMSEPNLFMTQCAPDQRHGRIDNERRKHHKRNPQIEYLFAASENAKAPSQNARRNTAHIPHEDPCRREIVHQKTGGGGSLDYGNAKHNLMMANPEKVPHQPK